MAGGAGVGRAGVGVARFKPPCKRNNKNDLLVDVQFKSSLIDELWRCY